MTLFYKITGNFPCFAGQIWNPRSKSGGRKRSMRRKWRFFAFFCVKHVNNLNVFLDKCWVQDLWEEK